MSAIRELLAQGPLQPPRRPAPDIELNISPREDRALLQEVENDEAAVSVTLETFVYVGDRL